ncbi:DUF3239 domain-containing protein [Lignipirellula cremea]|uniref:Uncharacterized protein n=1 Tax=Lignipirellula cremea TaxID=2528010 RepID=A0A518DVQ4_9BACT|nr:DUF3239 domain-containing protein [Lignipirellula cremea]QDU95922.1 hypothetical protein Pla8534_37410 [Lignipirellula cremea]
MSVEVSCACGQRFAAERRLIGKRVQCPSCGGPIDVLDSRGSASSHFANAPPPPSNYPAQGGYPSPGGYPPQGGYAPQTPTYVPPTYTPPAPKKRKMKKAPFGVAASDSWASNPGRLRANPFQYCLHYPLWPAVYGLMFVGFLPLIFAVHWLFCCVSITGLILLIREWFVVRQHFWCGCVNPGVVVSLNPMLIAVCTDLSKGSGTYLAVKVIRSRLDRIQGQPPQIGTRVATVALYDGAPIDLGKPAWHTFYPVPVECVTTDLADMQGVLASISATDWQDLSTCLAQVPQPFRTGLYRMGRH